MKSTGIVRPVDKLGRIVLPIELRWDIRRWGLYRIEKIPAILYLLWQYGRDHKF